MDIHLSFDNVTLNYVYSNFEPELLYLIAAVSSYYHFYYKRLTRTAQLPLPRKDYENRLNFFEWFVSVYFISLCYITFKNRYIPVLNDYFKDIVEQNDSTEIFFQPPLGLISMVIVGVYFCYALLYKIKKRPTPENDNHRPESGSDSDSDSDIIDYHAYIYEFLQRNTERNRPHTAPESLAIFPAPPASIQPRSTSTQTDPPPLQIEPPAIQTQSSFTQTQLTFTQTEPPFYEHLTDAYQREMATIFNAPPAAATTTTTTTENLQQVAESTPANDDEPFFDSILEILVNAADILSGAIDNLQRNNDAASFDLVLQALIQSTIVLNRAVKLDMNPFSRSRYSSESQTSQRSVQPTSTPASQSTIPRASEVATNNNGAEIAAITDITHATNVDLTTSNADNIAVEVATDHTATENTATDNTATDNTATDNTATDNTATNAEVVATENTPSRPESSQSSHSCNSSSSNLTRSNQSNHSNQFNHSNHSNPPDNSEPMVEDTNTQSNAEENTSNVTKSTTKDDANTEPKKDKGKGPYNSTNNTTTSGNNSSNAPKTKMPRKQTNQKTQKEIDGDAETNTQQQRTYYSSSAKPNEPVGVKTYTPEDWESIKSTRTKEFNLGNEPTNNSNKWLSDTDFSVGISTGWEGSDMSIRTDTPVSELSASPTDLAVTDEEITEKGFTFTPRTHSAIRSSLSKTRSAISSNLSTSRSTRATIPTRSRIPIPPIPERSHISEAESEFLIPVSPDISSIATSPSVIFGSGNYSTPLIPEPFVPASSNTTPTSSAPRSRLTTRAPNLPQPTTIDWSDPISPKSESPDDEWIMESMYGAQEQAKNSSSNLKTQQASSSQQQTHDSSSTGAVSKWANFVNLLSTTGGANPTGTGEQRDSWTTVGPRQRSSRPSKRGGLKKKKVTFQLETRELSQTRCRRWPYCNQFEECTFSHPHTDCLNGDSCQYKHRCGYLHHPRDDKNYKTWLNRKKYM